MPPAPTANMSGMPGDRSQRRPGSPLQNGNPAKRLQRNWVESQDAVEESRISQYNGSALRHGSPAAGTNGRGAARGIAAPGRSTDSILPMEIDSAANGGGGGIPRKWLVMIDWGVETATPTLCRYTGRVGKWNDLKELVNERAPKVVLDKGIVSLCWKPGVINLGNFFTEHGGEIPFESGDGFELLERVTDDDVEGDDACLKVTLKLRGE